MSKKQMGFTLIEIVMVLVLLGILSAVAVPKYFDLRAQAEEKAMAAVAAEVQAQVNGKFAQEILKTGTNKVACTTASETAQDVLSEVQITSSAYTLAWDGDADDSKHIRSLKITPAGAGSTAKTFDIGIPACN